MFRPALSLAFVFGNAKFARIARFSRIAKSAKIALLIPIVSGPWPVAAAAPCEVKQNADRAKAPGVGGSHEDRSNVSGNGHARPPGARAIPFETVRTLIYSYGNFFEGYGVYRYDAADKRLEGAWDFDKARQSGNASKALSRHELEAVEAAFEHLKISGVRGERDPCMADGPVDALEVEYARSGRTLRRNYETRSSSDVCQVGAYYATGQSMKALLDTFERILPPPSGFVRPAVSRESSSVSRIALPSLPSQ